MILLLSLLNLNLYFLLYRYTTSNISCNILAFSATKTMSSANISKLTTNSPYLAPPTFFTSSANPSIKIEKSTGDKIQPCLNPTSNPNHSVFSPPNLTQLPTFRYKFFTTLHIFPPIPFSNILFPNPSLQTVSDAFLMSKKPPKVLFLPLLLP